MTFDLRSELRRYGAVDTAIKLLDDPHDASVLRYVDLFPESLARKDRKGTPAPTGVIEHEDRPLLYVYRDNALSVEPGDLNVPELVRSLACRGEGHFMAVVRPGELVVYPVGLLTGAPKPKVVRADNPRAPLLIAELAAGRVGSTVRQQLATATSLHQLLFELITSVAQALRESGALSINRQRDEVLPLIGRAVFTRFLTDRGIVNPQTFPALYTRNGRPEDAFVSPELAARTCAWLDSTFNGELLPLLFDIRQPGFKDYKRFFESPAIEASDVLQQLTNVMYRAPNGRLALELAWEGVDFAHVPIGLLSEVYEDYAHQFYRDAALRESVRYTPRHLAEFTVTHAFAGLPQSDRRTARVLDPAAGAGIFLVLALQQLVSEHWRASGQRPDTETIRSILYNQIRGYDINPSALTLAALSLYLTALEIDPDPFPPEKLRFQRLLGHVLHNVRDTAASEGTLVLGSLGTKGNLNPTEGPFAIVTGNPPWTSYANWRDGKMNFNGYAEGMVRRVLADHRSQSAKLQALATTYAHNDQLPDTAFLWRAIEWAKPNGVIAFIMAGRLLFKRGEGGAHVRESLFQSMQVTGILNGALLLPLWPQVNQPFCILFARNRAPAADARMTLVTPVLDTGPAGEPRMRIDAEARQPMSLSAIFERPYLFKALTRGGRLDVDIIGRIQALERSKVEGESDMDASTQTQPVRDFWRAEWTCGVRRYGQGFKPTGPRSPAGSKVIRTRLAELLTQNAAVLTPQDTLGSDGTLRIELHILPQQLRRLVDMELHRLNEPSIFQPPLVIIREGFGPSAQKEPRARLYLGKAPLVVSRSYYAFSCSGHPQPLRLAKLLFCIVNSDLFGYYTLLHSAKFGLERRTLLMEDVEDFPIPASLNDRQFSVIERVADELVFSDATSWRHMNRAVNQLYGLTPADEQVIKDSLSTRMPYSDVQTRAEAPATLQQRQAFARHMESLLQPFFAPDGETATVRELEADLGGWTAFEIEQNRVSASADTADTVLQLATSLAENEGASRLFFAVGIGRLRVAVRNQYRYLTLSQARLCAIDALREHWAVFPLPVATA